jgi:hypothetical protein
MKNATWGSDWLGLVRKGSDHILQEKTEQTEREEADRAKCSLPRRGVDLGCYLLQVNVCRGFMRDLGATEGATSGATKAGREEANG